MSVQRGRIFDLVLVSSWLAAGSAVGLGNIWGFPTQFAMRSNGGAAFVLVYLVLAFLLAYPVLMAELTLGPSRNHGNMIAALAKGLA